MIEYDRYQQSLKHLELQFENYRSMDGSQSVLTQETIGESVIQRFETCWDCLWKVLKRYLVVEIGLPDVPNGPNPVLRLANENLLLPSSIDNWLIYAKMRVKPSHDYRGEKAKEALNLMKNFITDAINIYQIMSGKIWE